MKSRPIRLLSGALTLLYLAGCSTTPEQEKAAALVRELTQEPLPRSGAAINEDLIALGDAAASEVIPLLRSPRAELRVNASWILGEIGSRPALRPLKHALACEDDATATDFEIQAICSILHINNNISARQALKAAEESLASR